MRLMSRESPFLLEGKMNKGESKERQTFPLWYLLSPEDRGKLAAYQWENFGVRIAIPEYPHDTIRQETKLEDVQEIDKLMREKPNAPKGRYG